MELWSQLVSHLHAQPWFYFQCLQHSGQLYLVCLQCLLSHPVQWKMKCKNWEPVKIQRHGTSTGCQVWYLRFQQTGYFEYVLDYIFIFIFNTTPCALTEYKWPISQNARTWRIRFTNKEGIRRVQLRHISHFWLCSEDSKELLWLLLYTAFGEIQR